MLPFKQRKSGGLLIREFNSAVKNEELVWHRDRSDRIVCVLEGKDWLLQLDNQIPKKLVEGQNYFIPSHNYHRLIKGKGTLVLAIKENKMKITKRQLRRIIKERSAGKDRDWQLEDDVSYFIASGPADKAAKYLEQLIKHVEAGGDVGWEDAMNSAEPEHTNMEYAKKRLMMLKKGDGVGRANQFEGKTMKITKRQLKRIIKEALGDRGDLPRKHQYKIGMRGPEDLPEKNFTGAPYNDSLADLRDGSFSAKAQQKWLDWGEGYGLQQEEDNEGQIIFYFDMDQDVDGTITNEAEIMGGSVEPAGYSDDGNMIIYTGEYIQ